MGHEDICSLGDLHIPMLWISNIFVPSMQGRDISSDKQL